MLTLAKRKPNVLLGGRLFRQSKGKRMNSKTWTKGLLWSAVLLLSCGTVLSQDANVQLATQNSVSQGASLQGSPDRELELLTHDLPQRNQVIATNLTLVDLAPYMHAKDTCIRLTARKYGHGAWRTATSKTTRR